MTGEIFFAISHTINEYELRLYGSWHLYQDTAWILKIQ